MYAKFLSWNHKMKLHWIWLKYVIWFDKNKPVQNSPRDAPERLLSELVCTCIFLFTIKYYFIKILWMLLWRDCQQTCAFFFFFFFFNKIVAHKLHNSNRIQLHPNQANVTSGSYNIWPEAQRTSLTTCIWKYFSLQTNDDRLYLSLLNQTCCKQQNLLSIEQWSKSSHVSCSLFM